jgi:hypothetical protein
VSRGMFKIDWWTHPNFNSKSSKLAGPIPLIGDCIFPDDERLAFGWVDLGIVPRHADAVLWHVTWETPQEFDTFGDMRIPVNSTSRLKWLVRDEDGNEWAACRYFAIRVRRELLVPVGVLVRTIRFPPWVPLWNRRLSEQMTREREASHATEPRVPHKIIFKHDCPSPESVLEVLRQRGGSSRRLDATALYAMGRGLRTSALEAR